VSNTGHEDIHYATERQYDCTKDKHILTN